jgi:hypothetical protein
MKNLTQNNRCPSRNWNRAPQDYKSRALLLHQRARSGPSVDLINHFIYKLTILFIGLSSDIGKHTGVGLDRK